MKILRSESEEPKEELESLCANIIRQNESLVVLIPRIAKHIAPDIGNQFFHTFLPIPMNRLKT